MNQKIAAIAIVVAGACTTSMNWRFSIQLGTTVYDSYIWAIFSVALDVTKWFMLPFAARALPNHKLRASAAVTIWLIATIYSFTAALGFAALNRDASTSERQAQAELNKTLQLMRQSPRWQSSAGCADATAPLSKDFCATYQATAAKVSAISQDADPQSTLLARISGIPQETVRFVLCIFLAVACEVISSLGFFALLPVPETPRLQPQTKPARVPWTPPPWPPSASHQVKENSSSGHCPPRPAKA